MSIEVSNESGDLVDEAALVDVARLVLERLRIHPLTELSILLVDESTMTDLHVRWMDEPGPTDVLSFPMDELRPPGPDGEPPQGLLGDVVLCPVVAARQAAAVEDADHDTQAELELLLVHGVLHLLGHDHAEPDEEREMFLLQADLLGKWRGSRSRGAGTRSGS